MRCVPVVCDSRSTPAPPADGAFMTYGIGDVDVDVAASRSGEAARGSGSPGSRWSCCCCSSPTRSSWSPVNKSPPGCGARGVHRPRRGDPHGRREACRRSATRSRRHASSKRSRKGYRFIAPVIVVTRPGAPDTGERTRGMSRARLVTTPGAGVSRRPACASSSPRARGHRRYEALHQRADEANRHPHPRHPGRPGAGLSG